MLRAGPPSMMLGDVMKKACTVIGGWFESHRNKDPFS